MSNFVMLTQILEKPGRVAYTRLSDEATSRAVETKYCLRPLLVATNHIRLLKEDDIMRSIFDKGHLPQGLDGNQSFTMVQLSKGFDYDSSCFTVVGHLETIASKIRDANSGN